MRLLRCTSIDFDPTDARDLSRVLSHSFPDVEVSRVQVVKRTSGTNSNVRLAVEYSRDLGAPTAIFAKLPPGGATQRELVKKSGMAAREVGFYRDVARSVPLRFPRAYHAAYDEETADFVLLLEDVTTSGAVFLDPEASTPFEVARRAVEDLADLHLAHRQDQALRRRVAWVGPQIRLREYGAGMLSTALEHCRSSLADEFARVARFYVDHHDAVHDAWEKGAWSVIHGDCHFGNVFLEKERIGFFDWGCMAYMPGIRDVGYYLCMGLSVDDRRAFERELLGLYVSRIAAGGGPDMSFDEAWRLHRIHAAYTVPASAPASIFELLRGKVEFDPSVADAFLRRSTAAIEDLEAYQALSDRLRKE